MTYRLADLTAEISEQVLWLEKNNGREIHKQWLINAVLAAHNEITESDFAVCCSRYTVEQHVDRYFRAAKKSEEDGTDQEYLPGFENLPGFEKLQKRYVVERKEEQVICYVYDMTDEELTWKAQQHRAWGEGHYKHASEIERFIDERRVAREAIGS